MPTIRKHEFTADTFREIAARYDLKVKASGTTLYIDGDDIDEISWGVLLAAFDKDEKELRIWEIESFSQFMNYYSQTNKFIIGTNGKKELNYKRSLKEQLDEHLNQYIETKKLYKKLIRMRNLADL